MGVSVTGVLTPDDLNKTDRRVIDVLAGGRVTPRYVADQLDVSRTYASERLRRLVEHQHVEKVAPGLYELVDDPRGDITADSDDVDVDALREAIAEARQAHENVDGNGIEAAFDRAEAILEGADDE